MYVEKEEQPGGQADIKEQPDAMLREQPLVEKQTLSTIQPSTTTFVSLPVEIQVQIWKAALPPKRLILIKDILEAEAQIRGGHELRYATRTPVLYDVCSISREVMIKSGWRTHCDNFSFPTTRRPVFNPEIDIFFLDGVEGIKRKILKYPVSNKHKVKPYGVKHLAVEFERKAACRPLCGSIECYYRSQFSISLHDAFEIRLAAIRLKKLKEFSIVFRHSADGEDLGPLGNRLRKLIKSGETLPPQVEGDSENIDFEMPLIQFTTLEELEGGLILA